MGQAISPIDPSVRDFIAAGAPKPQAQTLDATGETESEPEKVEALAPAPLEKPLPEPSTPRKGEPRSEDEADRDPGPLVSVTFRIPEKLSHALLKASMDRKLRRRKPTSQQDIAAAALEEWLRKHAYL